jgi:hypothetical protein
LGVQTEIVSGLHFGSPRKKFHSNASAAARCRVNLGEEREATAPSIIRKIKIVQRGKEMPPDGGIVLPKNVHVQPFLSKG